MGKKIIKKPWDESISRSVLLNIMNAQYRYLDSDFYVEITKEVFDRIFGKESILSRDMLVFENEAGDIVGFTGVSNISGASEFWRIINAILPEYCETQLIEYVIEASISLGKNLKIKELTYYTLGPLAAPFDQAFENLGFRPIFYLLEMHLTDFKDEKTPIIPRGVTVRKLKEIDDYDQFVSVLNEAFRPLIDFHPTTIERTKNRHKYRRKQREVEHFMAYENEHLIGYCNVEYDRKEAIGYVAGLAVHPKYQHRGIGRYLLVEGIKQLRSNKCKYVELIAYFDNDKAVNLYQHIGFYSLEKKKRKCYRINTSRDKIGETIV